jgi:DNA-binding CsgD family transcriptional regulator
VANKTIVRSIGFGKDEKLYAGAQDELGYFAADAVGQLQYTSLKKLLPPTEQTFTDVWQLECIGDAVFFRTNQKIYRYANGKIEIYKAYSTWLSIFKHNNNLYAQDEKEGIFKYENNTWLLLIPAVQLPTALFITDAISITKDSSLLSTKANGLLLLTQNKLIPYKISSSALNTKQHITALATMPDSTLLIGTYYNGIYKLNKAGNIEENITTKNGLQNNTVQNLLAMPNGAAWMCLDNGLAYCNFKNSIKHINPPAFNNGAGYCVQNFNNNFYFALSTGLLYMPYNNTTTSISNSTASPTEILNGLTWNVSVVNNKLFCGRDDGLWQINNTNATPIDNSRGFWKTVALPNANNAIAAGNYYGVQLYDATTFTKTINFDNFKESSRFVETDGDYIWVSHPYRGVYKINVADKTVQQYTQQNGLPSEKDNHVFTIKNKIVFTTINGIYEYNAAINKMQYAKEFSNLFGNKYIRHLKEDDKGNIWFVQDKIIGVVDYSNGTPTLQYIPELNNRILSGFENIFTYNTKNILVGAENGFYTIDYAMYKQQHIPFAVYLTQLKTITQDNTILSGGYQFENSINKELNIPYKQNSLHFDYAASLYNPQIQIEYCTYLKGFDKNWSEWNVAYEKDYTNLPAGSYTLQVKARTSPSHISEVYNYTFTILPPWYKTWWAYILYAFAIAALVRMLYKLQAKKYKRQQEAKLLANQKKYKEEQQQLAYQYQLAIEKTEKENIRLRNQNLEAEIELKNSELASIAMNLVQKKEFLNKLYDELNKLTKNDKEIIDGKEFKKVLRSITSEEKLEEEWEQFSIHFNRVHNDYLVQLKNKYPQLNASDLKLCAYLRMNLSSKEIAPLLSISLRGVEIARYRLRKKLQLMQKEDLFQFLMGV